MGTVPFELTAPSCTLYNVPVMIVKLFIAIVAFIVLEIIGDAFYNATLSVINTLTPSLAVSLLKVATWVLFHGSPAIPPVLILAG